MVQRLKDWWNANARLGEGPVPEQDPIVSKSYAGPIAFWSFLLVLTLVWALYEEAWGLRPWRDYQARFVSLYREALTRIRPDRLAEEEAIRNSEGYQELQRQLEEAEQAITDQMASIEAEERAIQLQLSAISKFFIEKRSEIQAKIYQVETAGPSDREDLEEELRRLEEGPYRLRVPVLPEGDGSFDPLAVSYEERDFSFAALQDYFDSLKSRQGALQARKVQLLRRPTQMRQALNEYLNQRLTGLTASQVDGLLHSLDTFTVEIKQIHNAEMNLVDRCESCHLGVRQPVPLTADMMGGMRVFASHPRSELLQIHEPEVFGCSPCHNGNGVATISETTAHGFYKHWLWPLWAPENYEAGCLHCHEADRYLEEAPVLTAGKDQFYVRGCWGCHPREGFDRETKELRDVQKNISDLVLKRQETEIRISQAIRRGDEAETNEEADRHYAQAERMTMSLADLDTRLEDLRKRNRELLWEVKRQGPNLKEIRAKLRPEWLPVWIQAPHDFRPGTKMPQFRLDEDQVRKISAFLWQVAPEGEVERQPAGNPARGRELFESRGCLACHSIGEGEQAVGGDFAANLSRVGEKVNYDYLVRWIHNPRQRLLPYCPVHERDITPADYASQGLEFKFDLENDRCPLGDHPLQVQNPTIMPSLRLSWQEARDIASYLMQQRREEAAYPPAPFLQDAALAEEGRFLVRHYGCSGCHEIAGLENEGKIGTDLTKEGSKPIERLDFALLTKRAKKEGWYNHKGFFENKLRQPDIYDQGKIKQPLERLRMPDFALSGEQIDQLTTFLLGSVDSTVPEQFHYRPNDHRKDIQEGWWVVSKYNCMACHQFTPAQETVLQKLPRYQTPEGKEQLPPSLVGEGARVNPNWLARFLKNPALDEEDIHRNGVRPYLEARMPTFNLSDTEVQKLVRFFQALSQQPLPYLPKPLDPLSSQELTMARQLFTHPSAPCLRCHATGDPVGDRTATAPNFLLVRERLKPDWTARWLVHPEIIRPGTAMPSGLFRWDGQRWVFALAELPSMRDYSKDHADLVVRYMFQFTEEEQRRLKR